MVSAYHWHWSVSDRREGDQQLVLAAAAALIAALDEAGIPRALVSDYPGLDKLEGMGLAGFPVVVSCRTLGALKPLPDGLYAAASQLGVPVSQLLHVGDRWDTDGAAAAAAGCLFRHIDQIDPEDPLSGLPLSCEGKLYQRLSPGHGIKPTTIQR